MPTADALPPLTGFSPLSPMASGGTHLIHLQGSGFRPGYNAAFTSAIIGAGIAAGGATSSGFAAGSVVGGGGPLFNVTVAGDSADVLVDFRGVTGRWSVRIIDPGNIPGDLPHAPISSPWFDFTVAGAEILLTDPSFVRIVNPNGTIGYGAPGPMPLSYAEVVNAPATAAAGVTVLNPGFSFTDRGVIVPTPSIALAGNAGATAGGSPVNATAGHATGPGPGGGIAADAVASPPVLPGQVPRSQMETLILIVLVAVVAYMAWKS